jgi:hypothetical protein
MPVTARWTIYAAIRSDDLASKLRVPIHDGVVSGEDLLLDVGAHPQDAFLDVAHLVVQTLAHMRGVVVLGHGLNLGGMHRRLLVPLPAHPNRPEM